MKGEKADILKEVAQPPVLNGEDVKPARRLADEELLRCRVQESTFEEEEKIDVVLLKATAEVGANKAHEALLNLQTDRQSGIPEGVLRERARGNFLSMLRNRHESEAQGRQDMEDQLSATPEGRAKLAQAKARLTRRVQ